jgi:UDP-perosamine 4-acetyltransferase
MSMVQQVLLLGGGGHAAVVADAVRSRGWSIAGYLDDGGHSNEHGLPGSRWLGRVSDLHGVLESLPGTVIVHAAAGDSALRRRWLNAARGFALSPIIHASAVISPSATIADGAFIGPLAVINARAAIGRGCIINSGAIIEHDCIVDELAHVAPRAVLCGGVTVGRDTLIGVGAVVRPAINIGANATVGAGAAVVADVPDAVTVVGVPARVANPIGSRD